MKFSENSWRCIYYTYSFVYGVIVLWNKPWFWDVKQCWYGYPHQVSFRPARPVLPFFNNSFSFQSVENDIWWYYMISMAFYWSLTVTQFFDIKRKDFWQMFLHHMVTLLLLGLSWVCNLHRVGSLVLVVHDCADIFLEVQSKTGGRRKTCSFANRFFLCSLRPPKLRNMHCTRNCAIAYLPFSRSFGL